MLFLFLFFQIFGSQNWLFIHATHTNGWNCLPLFFMEISFHFFFSFFNNDSIWFFSIIFLLLWIRFHSHTIYWSLSSTFFVFFRVCVFHLIYLDLDFLVFDSFLSLSFMCLQPPNWIAKATTKNVCRKES